MSGAPQGYIGRNPGDGRTVINRQTSHVTTGVQTSFTMTVGYEVGFLDVYLNGIKQTETLDYTASDGSTINFSPSFAPMNGDVLEFIAFETLNITNIKSARRNFAVGRDLTVDGSVTIGSSLTVATDLVVNGTFTTINTEILDVEDKTVGIASTSSPSNTTADGAGIVIYGGSDGDKSITWNTEKSNFVIVGGGVSIGTGVTISTPADNVLAFSVNSAEKARFNNFGAFTVGYEGEAWHESTYVGVLQAGSGAWIGQTPGAGARAEWVNNAYYDSVNTRWEYIAADEANRIYLENGELHLQSAAAGSADGLITWNERLAMTVGGDFKIGPNASTKITLSSSGNINAVGIVTATSFAGTFSGSGANLTALNIVTDTSPQLGGILDTNSNNITFADNVQAVFGTGSDSAVRFNGTDLVITTSGKIKAYGGNTGIELYSNDNSETLAKFIKDGAVELYHNNIKTFQTTSEGATFDTGSSSCVVRLTSNTDAVTVLQGFNSDFTIKAPSGGGILLQTNANEDAIKCVSNGAVELYHDDTKKFETLTNGIKVHGNIFMDDNDEIRLGDSGDFQLFHNSSTGEARIFNSNAAGINIITDLLNVKNNANTEVLLKATDGGSVDLYFNNSKKLETTLDGINIPDGMLQIQSTSCNIDLMETGGPSDHTRLRQNNGNFYLQKLSADKNTSTTAILVDHGNENVELYKGGTKQCETSANGLSFPSGKGIDFGATANGGTNTISELLDDYEEGEWQPAFSNGLVASAYESNGQRGQYTKVGNIVHFTFILHLATASNQDGNVIDITGLPFTSGDYSNLGAPAGGMQNFYQDGFYNANDFSGICVDTNTYIRLYSKHNGSYLTGTSVNGGREIRCHGMYSTPT